MKKTDTILEIELDTDSLGPYMLGQAIDKIPRSTKDSLLSGGSGRYRITVERIAMADIESTEHFQWSEFECKDGTPVPEAMRKETRKLMEQLEVLRAELGDVSIRIVSGYRSPAHNAKIGGAEGSKHMLGQAADIRVSGHPPKDVADTIERLIRAGRMLQGGLGRYPGFTHYDVRGNRARWGKN